MKDKYTIKGIEYETKVGLTFEAHDEKNTIYLKPSDVDSFLAEGIDDIDLFMAEKFLHRQGFFKEDDGRWHDRSFEPEKIARSVTLPSYFFRNGGLIIQFGVSNQTLNLSNGVISSTDDLPTKVIPLKVEKNFYNEGNLICNHTTTYDEWYKNAIQLTCYEYLEKKINRWVAGEFEKISMRKYDISYLDWYLNKHPNASEKIYQWFEPIFDDLIEHQGHLHGELKASKWPKGFFEWLIDNRDGEIKNLINSAISLTKFAI